MRILFSSILMLSSMMAFSQSFEIHLTPGFGYRSISAKSGVPTAYKDSIGKIDHIRQNWSGGVAYIHKLDRDAGFQIGLNYRRQSFKRKLEDLQFHDTVHPSIGRIEDLSQTSYEKDAHFYHRYHYLSIPITYQRFIAPKYGRNKYILQLTMGASADLLFDSGTEVFLRGYSVKGKSRYKLEADYTGNLFNVSALLGIRYALKLTEKATFNLQPHFAYQLLESASDDFLSLRLYQFNVQTGVSFDL